MKYLLPAQNVLKVTWHDHICDGLAETPHEVRLPGFVTSAASKPEFLIISAAKALRLGLQRHAHPDNLNNRVRIGANCFCGCDATQNTLVEKPAFPKLRMTARPSCQGTPTIPWDGHACQMPAQVTRCHKPHASEALLSTDREEPTDAP